MRGEVIQACARVWHRLGEEEAARDLCKSKLMRCSRNYEYLSNWKVLRLNNVSGLSYEGDYTSGYLGEMYSEERVYYFVYTEGCN